MKLWLLTALLLAALAAAFDAGAHAVLLSTQPADGAVLREPPARVTFSFNEPVQLIDGRVLDGAGRVRASGAPGVALGLETTLDLPAGLAMGGYIATYRVVSADGHPVSGSIAFAVGEGAAAWQAPTAAPAAQSPWDSLITVNRAIYLVAMAAAAGGSLYLLLVAGNRDAVRRSLRPMMFHAAWIAGACALLAIGLQGGLLVEADPVALFGTMQAWRQGLASTRGTASCTAMAGFLCLMIALLLPSRRASGVLLATGAATVIASFALAGHAASAASPAAATVAWLVHAGAAAFWLGSLKPLLTGLRAAPETSPFALRRFSSLAVVMVCSLLVAGAVMAILQIQDPGALTTTGYGKVLLAKIVLVASMLALAAINRFCLLPRLELKAPGARERLATSLQVEIVLGIGVLIAAAVLSQQVPPSRLPAAANAGAGERHGAEHMLRDDKGRSARLRIDQTRAGEHRLSVNLADPTGKPLDAMEVKAELSRVDVEPLSRPMKRTSPGEYRYTGPELALGGRWQVRIGALISDFEQADFSATISIPR